MVLAPIVRNCSFERSCRCNVWIRQRPNLKVSASYNVFHLTFNVDEFTLNGSILCEQYKHVVHSSLVTKHRLFPHIFPVLKSNFVRSRHSGIKWFHNRCVIPAERFAVMWSTFHAKFCRSADDAIMTLLNDRNYWWAIFVIDPNSFHQNASVQCKEFFFKQTVTALFINRFFQQYMC